MSSNDFDTTAPNFAVEEMERQATPFSLLLELPSLKRKNAPVEPWDAFVFLEWLCTGDLDHGELLVGRLLLNVWSANVDWVEAARSAKLPNPEAAKRFDVIEAASVWDREHLVALATWLCQDNKFP